MHQHTEKQEAVRIDSSALHRRIRLLENQLALAEGKLASTLNRESVRVQQCQDLDEAVITATVEIEAAAKLVERFPLCQLLLELARRLEGIRQSAAST